MAGKPLKIPRMNTAMNELNHQRYEQTMLITPTKFENISNMPIRNEVCGLTKIQKSN
jgi:hypothetical protein